MSVVDDSAGPKTFPFLNFFSRYICEHVSRFNLHPVCENVYVALCPDRLMHGTHPMYWFHYRSGWLWAAADRGLGTAEHLS